jgi:hypothetical protein
MRFDCFVHNFYDDCILIDWAWNCVDYEWNGNELGIIGMCYIGRLSYD